jgi:hypothetical protein
MRRRLEPENDGLRRSLLGDAGKSELAAHIARDLATPPLARIRATADQWRNSVTALATVLTAATLFGGTIDTSKRTIVCSPPTRCAATSVSEGETRSAGRGTSRP